VRRLRFGIWNAPFGRRGIEEAVARYPIKTQLDVYYSPTDPKMVILEPHVAATSTWVALCVGLGLGLLPVALYFYGRMRKPTNEKRL
jgi:hypothetical protein